MGLLTSIKSKLRVSSSVTAYDDEIKDLIDQCIEDLRASGFVSDALSQYDTVAWSYDVDLPDANLRRLITLYCKAYFGLNNPDKDWFAQQYFYKKSEVLNQLTQYTSYDATDYD